MLGLSVWFELGSSGNEMDAKSRRKQKNNLFLGAKSSKLMYDRFRKTCLHVLVVGFWSFKILEEMVRVYRVN